MPKKKIKVVVGYPPVESSKGVALLSQNRQFQYFNAPTFIYPMVPAYAASLAQERGYDVYWMDGIAEQKKYDEWAKELVILEPDYILIEVKAPVVKLFWKKVDDIKERLPETKVILAGDHVTYDPTETLDNCEVDYIITGGDYDFVFSDLLDALTKGNPFPSGVWGRKEEKGFEKRGNYWCSGDMDVDHNMDDLPFVDRDLTKWKLYAYANGNYKYKPATYMYSGRDCWWNRCTFCIWDHSLYPVGTYKRFSPERLFAEVKHVVDKYGVREIFDDAGTLFVGPPLKKFCNMLIDSGYNKKVVYSCNMRINALTREYYDLMAKANFRFILYGLESGNQETLDRLDKGLKVEEIEPNLKNAKEAGLEPHVTIMLGYPWETEEMAQNTIEVSKNLFKKGYVDTMQATIVIPYPGSPLHKQCQENDWFQVGPKDYEKFDMRHPVMKVPFSNERLLELTQSLYSSFFSPQYLWRKIKAIRTKEDIAWFFMAAKRLLGHLLDFDKEQEKVNWWHPKFWSDAIKSMFGQLKKSSSK